MLSAPPEAAVSHAPPASVPEAFSRIAQRRLQLAGLPPGVRRRALTGLAACALTSVLLVAAGMNWSLPGGSMESNVWGSLTRALAACAYVLAAVIAFLLTSVAALAGPGLRRLILLTIGLTAAAIGSELVAAADDIGRIRSTETILVERGGTVVDAVPYAGANTNFLAVSGWLIVALGALLALLPWKRASKRLLAVEIAATLPFLLGLGVFLLSDRSRLPLADVRGFGWSESAQSASGVAVITVLMSFALLLSVIFLWQALTSAQLARDAGTAARAFAERASVVLAVLLVAKLLWISVGYLDRLPAALGGGATLWASSRSNGPVAWGLAILLAAGAGAWLLRRRGPLSERGLVQAGWILIAGFAAIPVVTAFTSLAAEASLFAPDPLFENLAQLTLWLSGLMTWSGVVTVYVAALAGTLILLSHRLHDWEMLGVFLLAFSIWSLPRAVAITFDRKDPSHLASIEPVTFDTAVTFVVVALAAVWWWRRRRGREGGPTPTVLALVLVASTWACYSGFLLKISPSGTQSLFFYVGLVVPAVYLFLFDAKRLNEQRPQRAKVVLATVASVALLLLAATVQIETGYLSPEARTTGTLGQVLFIVPFAAMLAAAAVIAERPNARRE